jgi:hypothetical protein
VSHACVRMNGHCTDMIDIRSGVKQGGIMSPQLYNNNNNNKFIRLAAKTYAKNMHAGNRKEQSY